MKCQHAFVHRSLLLKRLVLFGSGIDFNNRSTTKIESAVRYLGIEVDDALAIAEQVGV